MGFQYSNLMQFHSLTFQQTILIDGFNGLGTVVLSLISENPRSRFMLELMLLLCRFWVLKCVARSQLLRLFTDGSDDTALLLWFPLKIRSVRILDTIVCSGSLVWLFSPAWDAIKLTLPGGWLHLSFRGHWPYQFRSDDGSCSELAPGLMFDNFLPIPDAQSLPFYPLVLKLVDWASDWPARSKPPDFKLARGLGTWTWTI